MTEGSPLYMPWPQALAPKPEKPLPKTESKPDKGKPGKLEKGSKPTEPKESSPKEPRAWVEEYNAAHRQAVEEYLLEGSEGPGEAKLAADASVEGVGGHGWVHIFGLHHRERLGASERLAEVHYQYRRIEDEIVRPPQGQAH